MDLEVDVRINGSVVTWARERLEASMPEAAAISGFTEDQLDKWESGLEQPSFMQARKLAEKLRIPFGYLLLSERPNQPLPLSDLRTMNGQPPRIPTPDLIEVVEDAIRKQHWFSEFLAANGGLPKKFVGKFSISDETTRIAADIRNTIGIDDQMRAESAPVSSTYLTVLVRRSEERGIMVLRSGTVRGNTHRNLNVREFRGFALPDPIAPIIFINSKDAVAAQVFTWAHEIAHIWLNISGVSLLDFSRKSREQSNQTEIKCNEIAAEVLVPASSFVHVWEKSSPLSTNLSNLKFRYRVSELVVLRKAYDLGLITEPQFKDGMTRYYDNVLSAKEIKKKGGGDYYNSLYARNSNSITASVTEAYSSGSMLTTEACRLLNVKRRILRKLVTAS